MQSLNYYLELELHHLRQGELEREWTWRRHLWRQPRRTILHRLRLRQPKQTERSHNLSSEPSTA